MSSLMHEFDDFFQNMCRAELVYTGKEFNVVRNLILNAKLDLDEREFDTILNGNRSDVCRWLQKSQFRMCTDCVNRKEFFTHDDIISVPLIFLYILEDDQGRKYCFDVRTLRETLNQRDGGKNIFTNQPFTVDQIRKIENRYEFVKNLMKELTRNAVFLIE